MTGTFSIRLVAGVGLAVVLTSALAGAQDDLKSRWSMSDMKVDGSPADWPALQTIAPKVTAAAANDGTTLRLIVATNDPTICARLLVGGLMVYVDPKNKKAQNFAIRVPPLGGKPLPGERVKPYLTYVGVFGPEKDEMHLVDPPSQYGIEAAAGVQDDTWYIELSLPLRAGAGQPYAPGVTAGTKAIGLGLVTPDPPKPPADDRGGGRGGAGSWGFGGFGSAYGGGAGPPPPRNANAKDALGKPVKVWTTIELAQR
jgi:hypothetical protein